MIYYHFKSKAALYREILRDMFGAVGARVASRRRAPARPRGQDPRLHRRDRRRGRGAAALPADLAARDRRRRASTSTRHAPLRPRRARGARRHHRGRPPRRPLPAGQSAAGAGRHHRAAHVLPCDLAAAPQARSTAARGVGTISRDEVVGHIQRVTLAAARRTDCMRPSTARPLAIARRPRAGRRAGRLSNARRRSRPNARHGLRRGDRCARGARSRRPRARAHGRRGGSRRRRRRHRAARHAPTPTSRCGAPPPTASRRTRSSGCCGPARAPKTSVRRARKLQSAQADVTAAAGRARRRPRPTSSASRRSSRQRRLASSSATMR